MFFPQTGNYGPVATGYFATIYLARNSLTRFESQVFQRVLEMNATIGIGYYENLDAASIGPREII